MKNVVAFVLLLLFSTVSCNRNTLQISSINSINFSDFIFDSELTCADGSFRAIDLHGSEFIVGGSPNMLLQNVISGEETNNRACAIVVKDSLEYDFRSVAITENAVFALSAGSPAKLYKGSSIKNLKLVYEENDADVFYDSMKFFNEEEGIAFGDEMNGCMSVLITRNGGESWQKLPCSEFLPANDGDGAFAASNTNIDIVNDHVWLASGTAIYRSENKGKEWEKIDLPIIQNKKTEGVYSIDFHCEKLGIAIGGDYSSPKANVNNLILTKDSGKTWEVISDEDSPGYRSCIQFIPNTDGKGIMVVGFEGIDVSVDRGETWKHISDEAYYSFRFFTPTTGIIVGKEKIHQFELEFSIL